MGLIALLRQKYSIPDLPPPNSFAGQTVLITGGNSGLGLAAAVHYANLGASQIIITSRSPSSGAAAVQEILSSTTANPKPVVSYRPLDLSTFTQTLEFANTLTSSLPPVDIVLLNAGLFNTSYTTTPDNWEEALQVHALSTPLLAILLLPWLRSSSFSKNRIPHLAIVDSGLHTTVNISAWPKTGILAYLSSKQNYKGGQEQYSRAMLLKMYAAREIAKLATSLVDGSPEIYLTTLCPGFCSTNLARQTRAKGAFVSALVSCYLWVTARSAEEGARSMILATATAPEKQGKFVKHYGTEEEYKRESFANLESEKGKAVQERVWEEMLEVFERTEKGLLGSKVKEIVKRK